MALPPSDRPPGAAKQTYYDDEQSAQHHHSPAANGQTDPSARAHEHGNATSLAPQDRSRPSVEATSEGGSKERSKSNGRRPSGQQRTCGKCQRNLTGQFVRALGDTYHLECFTCHVRTKNRVQVSRECIANNVAGLWQDRSLQVLSSARSATEPVSTVRD